MRQRLRATVLLALAASAAPAHAAHPFAAVEAAASNGSGFVSQAEAGTSFDQERYRISARARTSRLGAEAAGTREEYSLRLERELYHVLVAGRFGTSPPSPQSAGYHLASGEAWFKLYGLTPGPEHLELSPVIWESSGPVPAPETLDSDWVTRIGGVYTNVDHHIQTNNGLFILVDGVWQFSVLETYRESTTLGVQGGGNRYNKTIDGSTPAILQNIVDYWGNRLPITGWPNNWQSIRLARRFGSIELSAAATRLNMLDGTSERMGAIEASWTPSKSWGLRAGVERARRTGGSSRTALILGANRRW